MSTNIDRSLYSRRVQPQSHGGVPTHRRALVGPSTLDKATELAVLAFAVLEGLFAIRFALKLLGANPENAFASLVYSVTDLFLRPFEGLIGTPQAEGMVLELTTVVAMVVYALAFWVIGRTVLILLRGPADNAMEVEVAVRESTEAVAPEPTTRDEAQVTAAGWRRDF